jgi:hypothetical protein
MPKPFRVKHALIRKEEGNIVMSEKKIERAQNLRPIFPVMK